MSNEDRLNISLSASDAGWKAANGDLLVYAHEIEAVDRQVCSEHRERRGKLMWNMLSPTRWLRWKFRAARNKYLERLYLCGRLLLGKPVAFRLNFKTSTLIVSNEPMWISNCNFQGDGDGPALVIMPGRDSSGPAVF